MISRTSQISGTDNSGRMLGPSAYSEALLPSLRLARSSRVARRIGKTLLFFLIVGFFLVALAPWQQSVTGSGYVIAFDPNLRRQTIEVPIKGRIKRWGEKFAENAHVSEGDLIAEITDIDPELMTRLKDQLAMTKTQVDALKLYVMASEKNRDAAAKVVLSQQALLETYVASRLDAIASADAAVASAKNKATAEHRALDEVEAALTQIEADYERQKQLFKEEIIAEVKSQLAERKYLEAKAKVAKAKQYVESAENDVLVKERDRGVKAAEAQGKIDNARAKREKAEGDVQKLDAEVSKARSELAKAEKAYSEMETKVRRQENQFITAPFDGYLTSVNPNRGGQMVKDGDTLCMIVPDTADLAVEVWLDGNDAPLVDPGRHVRLQFEGWPAVQFTGWPSVAVGTFGGSVVSIDPIDNGKGKFRIIVKPDDDVHEWPDERYLRQGVQANSWVLLEQVPLWREIWRRMNGFPPVVTPGQDMGGKSKSKPPKLPK